MTSYQNHNETLVQRDFIEVSFSFANRNSVLFKRCGGRGCKKTLTYNINLSIRREDLRFIALIKIYD